MGGQERRGHPNQEREREQFYRAPAVELRQAGYGLTETVMLKGWQNMPSHSMSWPRQCAQAQFPAQSLAPSKLSIKVSLLPHVERTQRGAVERREELRTWLLNETCFPGNDEIRVT